MRVRRFAGVPSELIEAARVDGARDFAVLVRVLLPISWPAHPGAIKG